MILFKKLEFDISLDLIVCRLTISRLDGADEILPMKVKTEYNFLQN